MASVGNEDWWDNAFNGVTPAFSFRYGGIPSSELLARWPAGREADATTWTAPDGFTVRLEQQPLRDGATEWLLRFKNTGSEPSSVLDEVRCLDTCVPTVRPAHVPEDQRVTQAEALFLTSTPRVVRARGSAAVVAEFEYAEDRLNRGESLAMGAPTGRSSDSWLPYFTTEQYGRGVFFGLGWSGAWSCTISNPDGDFRVMAGIDRLRLRLKPGEDVRGVRVLAMPWEGDRVDAHNQFRRLLRDFYTPRIDGRIAEGPFSIAQWGGMGAGSQLERIAIYEEQQLPQDYVWIDAGWFGDDPSPSPTEFTGEWSQVVGDWQVNPHRLPDGLEPIVDAVERAGMELMLWLEPGRARVGSAWPEEHPDWFLSHPADPDNLLLNFGNPDARKGALELVTSLIEKYRLGVYREDFNIAPAPFWAELDEPDRLGIAEIRYIEGHYAFWDELRRRFPRLIIDNCASGGNRLDLEAISRSVALWRTDYTCASGFHPIGSQAAGMNLSLWIPMHGSGTWASMPTRETASTYRVRSSFGPALQLSSFTRDSHGIQADYPWDWFKKMADDYLRARPLYMQDYFPLTSALHSHLGTWAAYQLNDPHSGAGLVMGFRRAAPSPQALEVQLRELDDDGRYLVEDADSGQTWVAGGRALKDGTTLRAAEPESATLLFYKRVETAD